MHLKANGRRRKIFIHTLVSSGGPAVTHVEKQEVLRNHFYDFLGAVHPRLTALNWDRLGYVQRDLSQLDAPFSMREIRAAVFALPAEKAPGPDGFIG